jgi:hypothetical protein
VPERTKGYFNSHRTVVSKLLHGYHIEITARSDRDLTPEGIVQKVADASGSKYSGGGSILSAGGPPPPIASKPVFTPTRVGGGSSGFNPLGRSRAPASSGPVDDDGWGADAPQVTRTQLEKVESAYKPTKVNLAQLTSQKEPSRYTPPQSGSNNGSDVVRGGYQPIGKVDINELRRQAKESGSAQDERPTIVKGAYEPIGKVDIAAIKAKAQRPAGEGLPQRFSPSTTEGEQEERPQSLANRSAAFQQGGRILTELPKPKVANKFGGASAFAGTKAPAPGGFDPINREKAAPVGIASRTYADEGGKTPAQIWAEKKARQGGVISPSTTGGAPTSPIGAQKSGSGWESSYTGKKWGDVQTTRTGQSAASNLSDQRTGPQQEEEGGPSSGGVGSIRDRFAQGSAPPPIDMSSRPNVGGGVAIPGLASRPSTNQVPAEHHVNLPTPPVQPRSPTPEAEDDYARPSSPIRVAMPISRTKEPEPIEPPEEPYHAIPTASLAKVASAQGHQEAEDDEPARGAGQAAADSTFGAGAATANPGADKSGRRAVIQYDYEKAEDNEIELVEGQYVSNIEMVDEDWWMGTNEKGEIGLFPSNYVELLDEEEVAPPAATAPMKAQAAAPAAPAAPPQPDANTGKTATAQYDYEAAEDNELSFPDGAKILNVVSTILANIDGARH